MTLNLPNVVEFGREICGDLGLAERREWWLSNGLGGYAAGTVAGSLTRRYHGLLIAPTDPPLGRHLLVAKADATLLHDGAETPLFTNRWHGGVVAPRGHVNIESFRLEGRMPVWEFTVGDLRLEQRIWMEQGANTTYIAFRARASGGRASLQARLRLCILVDARDHHAGTQAGDFDVQVEHALGEMQATIAGRHVLVFKARGGEFTPHLAWHHGFELAVEQERGLSGTEDHLCIGELTLDLGHDEWVGMVASLDARCSAYLGEAMRRFEMHDLAQLRRAAVYTPELVDAPDWIRQLVLAADSFVFARPTEGVPDGESVIAGYPWFGDWGRDTMIALPGLALATGRRDTALRVLRTFARYLDQGMLPNLFPGSGERPEYNTVDAALWFVEAWRAYFAATGDRNAVGEVLPTLASIIDWHIRGTRYGIGIDPADGLLRAGEPGVQLTWMDAKVGDWVVTPRVGKPVEVNALWFNALCAMAGLADAVAQPAERFRLLANQVRASFRRFVRPDGQGLFDVIDGPHGEDQSVRPNQIFALSLAHTPLDAAVQTNVLDLVGRSLLTSFGLRSLDAADPAYRPHYVGGVWERDGGYHQGPVWSWLLGHYAVAAYRVSGDAAAAQAHLLPLSHHLLDAGLGTISEIFDGAPPHQPRGAPSQAWSVACTVQAWVMLEQAKRNAFRVEAADSVAAVA